MGRPGLCCPSAVRSQDCKGQKQLVPEALPGVGAFCRSRGPGCMESWPSGMAEPLGAQEVRIPSLACSWFGGVVYFKAHHFFSGMAFLSVKGAALKVHVECFSGDQKP